MTINPGAHQFTHHKRWTSMMKFLLLEPSLIKSITWTKPTSKGHDLLKEVYLGLKIKFLRIFFNLSYSIFFLHLRFLHRLFTERENQTSHLNLNVPTLLNSLYARTFRLDTDPNPTRADNQNFHQAQTAWAHLTCSWSDLTERIGLTKFPRRTQESYQKTYLSSLV